MRTHPSLRPVLDPRLLGIHNGATATVIGKGPSLLEIQPGDIGTGPVMVLNHAIHHVRRLELPNLIYSFQKDGCIAAPVEPEVVILSYIQSRSCFRDYAHRYVVDVRRLRLPSTCMSLTFAVVMAKAMGCQRARLLAFDSYTRSDFRQVLDDVPVGGGRGYLHAADQAKRYAERVGIELEWAA